LHLFRAQGLATDVCHQLVLKSVFAAQFLCGGLLSLDRGVGFQLKVCFSGNLDTVLSVIFDQVVELALVFVELSHELNHSQHLNHLDEVGFGAKFLLGFFPHHSAVSGAVTAAAKEPFPSGHVIL